MKKSILNTARTLVALGLSAGLSAGLGACLALSAGQAAAQALTVEQARTAIAPFYDALNQPGSKDVAGLITSATSPDFVSCSGNDLCSPRDKVIEAIAGRTSVTVETLDGVEEKVEFRLPIALERLPARA